MLKDLGRIDLRIQHQATINILIIIISILIQQCYSDPIKARLVQTEKLYNRNSSDSRKDGFSLSKKLINWIKKLKKQNKEK